MNIYILELTISSHPPDASFDLAPSWKDVSSFSTPCQKDGEQASARDLLAFTNIAIPNSVWCMAYEGGVGWAAYKRLSRAIVLQ